MHQRRTARIAQDRLDLVRTVPGDRAAPRRCSATGQGPDRAVGGQKTHGRRLKRAVTSVNPEARATSPTSAATGPRRAAAPGGFIAEIQPCAPPAGPAAGEPCHRWPCLERVRGAANRPVRVAWQIPPRSGARGHHRWSSCRPSTGQTPSPAHSLDLGRDRLDQRQVPSVRVGLRVGGVKPSTSDREQRRYLAPTMSATCAASRY